MITTRFNDETWNENKRYREKYKIPCLYPVPNPISEKVEPHSLLFVIEMNNACDVIEGIGLIRNTILYHEPKQVYQERNFNRFCYQGNYYLDRETLLQYDASFVKSLENILFKGKGHLKRGSGMTLLTDKCLRRLHNRNPFEEIKAMFLKHYVIADLVTEKSI